jgi:hypothetical protein
MATKRLDLRPASNPELMNAVRNEASSDYRSRIPEATQANMRETAELIHKFNSTRNEFDENLINRIGLTVIQEESWNNPLAVFKQGFLPFGSTVEDVMLDLVKSSSHDWEADSLEKEVFGQRKIRSATSFYQINRQDKYCVTENRAALRRAFMDENGLGKYVHSIAGRIEVSNQYDEFVIMANQLVETEKNNGFYLVNTNEVTDEATAKAFLIEIRTYIDTLKFMDTMYNPAQMHVSAQPHELVFITTPRIKANMDVHALAAAFNLEFAEAAIRIIAMPDKYWNIDGAQGILTTEKFFQVWDTVLETHALVNPDGLYTNYWGHFHGIFAQSRFVPQILFTTKQVTEQVNVDITVDKISTPVVVDGYTGEETTGAPRGQFVQVLAKAETNRSGLGEAVTYEITSAPTSAITSVNNSGIVYVGPDEHDTVLKLTITSVVDPSKSTTIDIPITGNIVELGYKTRVEPAPAEDGDGETP